MRRLVVLSLLFLGCHRGAGPSPEASAPDGGHRSSRAAAPGDDVDRDARCGGIVSCVVEGVGALVALPFRAVAAVVDVIF